MSMMNRFRLRPAAAALFVGSALLLAGCGQVGPGNRHRAGIRRPSGQRIAVVLCTGAGNRKRHGNRNRRRVAGGQRQRR